MFGSSGSLQHWTNVYQPITTNVASPSATARPTDLVHWLAHHPALNVATGPVTAFIGDRPAQRITFTLDPRRVLATGPPLGCSVAAECLILADTPDIPVVINSDVTATVIAADHDPTGLVLTVVAPSENFNSTIDTLIDSLTVP
jgi:hypothetical protein